MTTGKADVAAEGANVNVRSLVQEALNSFVSHLKSHQTKLETRFSSVTDRLSRIEQKMSYLEGECVCVESS